jgi:hypothetical protein
MVPGGREGATVGKTIFTCVYIEYNLLQKLLKGRARSFSRGEIITKMQIRVGII